MRMILSAIKACGLVLCVFLLEWIILYQFFKDGFSDYDTDIFASLIGAICATVLTIYLFRRFAPPRRNSN